MMKGKAQGIAERKTEGKREIIKNLASIGMPIEKIAQAVELSNEEVYRYLNPES